MSSPINNGMKIPSLSPLSRTVAYDAGASTPSLTY